MDTKNTFATHIKHVIIEVEKTIGILSGLVSSIDKPAIFKKKLLGWGFTKSTYNTALGYSCKKPEVDHEVD